MKKTSSKNKSDFLKNAPAGYIWPRCPKADRFVRAGIKKFLSKHAFAKKLARRMAEETSTEFLVWVDHLVFPARELKPITLNQLGFVRDKKAAAPHGVKVFRHPHSDLPSVLYLSKARAVSCAIKTESIRQFQLAHTMLHAIEGRLYSPLRMIRIRESGSELIVLERRGGTGFIPGKRNVSDYYVAGFKRWAQRCRHFKSDAQGMRETLKLARILVKDLDEAAAATAFLEGERVYWQGRNFAARVQKARQDALGLGWANHDHHTFRSSRPLFCPGQNPAGLM